MTEYVFRPTRQVKGKRVLSRLYCGRYSLGRGLKPVNVYLHTPDELVARKLLRDLIVEKQREAVGLIAPKAQREALLVPLPSLIEDYGEFLRREVSPLYRRDTVNRILRIISETGWQFLGDIRPESFLKWRARQTCSAKTIKEYQISLSALLNYLVMIERLERNPLSKIEHVATRGREKRPSRSYTEQELRSLFAIGNKRVLFYVTLHYTAARKSEVASLVWGDIFLDDDEKAAVIFRASVTKTKRERVVPLHPGLLHQFRLVKPENCRNDSPVFDHTPTRKQLLSDLVTAGIERKDELGRVVHFHAFRKTARTIAIAIGVSERVCDEILGHENAHRMGTRYTDMRGIPLRDWLKLPWLGRAFEGCTQLRTLKTVENLTIRQLVLQLFEAVKTHSPEGKESGGEWSGRQDSNLRPPGPKPGALPD